MLLAYRLACPLSPWLAQRSTSVHVAAMPHLLILWHSRTGASAALAAAAHAGAAQTGEVQVLSLPVAGATSAHMLFADAFLFVGPENLGGLSGAMKELLDVAYYPLLGQVEGRAYGHIVAAGSDGEGAARQLARIATGWRLKAVADPLIVAPHAKGTAQTQEAILAPKIVPDVWLARARDLGALMAAGLAIGMF